MGSLPAYRAGRAKKAVRSVYKNHYRILTQEDLTDILADLRHLCDSRGWDFCNIDRIAYHHYIQEKR